MLKRTKIVATLGPATDNPRMLEKMINAGLDVVRINFSHGDPREHERRFLAVREVAERCQRSVAILMDLQGPKIRIGRFIDKKIQLKKDDHFCLDADFDDQAGTQNVVGIDYKQLPKDVRAGDILLLNDGLIELTVESVQGNKIHCIVNIGGELSNNKGINRQGGGLSAAALTEKDLEDLKLAAKLGADFIAVSFPRSAKDIEFARELLYRANGTAGIIAKIERTEAVQALDEIIDASDGVMVARGDLGVEIGDAELPAVQKLIIHQCRYKNKPVITATQMMESMITSPLPTRAEVFDVANAVIDGTDAVMLSAETATGAYPDKVIQAMARICLGAEKTRFALKSEQRMEISSQRLDEAIAMATMYCANHFDIKAIVALTESGSTPLWMSRVRSGIPVYALSSHVQTLNRMCLFRGVYPVPFDMQSMTTSEVNREAIQRLQEQNIVKDGDRVIITRGDLLGVHGHTNSMKIVEVGDVY